jgi:hypothetical protein
MLPLKIKDIVESVSQSLRSVSLFSFRHYLLIVLLCIVSVSMRTVVISVFLHSLVLVNGLCGTSEEHHLCPTASANAIHPSSFHDTVLTTTQRPTVLPSTSS